MGFFSYFNTVLVVSLFWSLLITTVLYAMPVSDRNIVIGFENAEGINTDFQDTAQEFQTNLQTQKNFGVVELGALALYSGNIMADLAGNFLFAIPSMFTLLFGGIFKLLHVNYYLQGQITLWLQTLFAVIASVILIQFLLGIRSQSLGAV